MLIAQLTDFTPDGHGSYRVHAPARALSRRPGVTVVDCPPDHRWLPWLVAHADVLVLHRFDADLPAVAATRRAGGRVTVVEASDDYFDLQPWSDYSLGWLDRARQDQFWRLAAAADAVQTSTPALAARWADAARRVLVFPNPPPVVPPLPPRPDRPLTVGWAGTGTHLPDWFAVAPAVAAWVRGRPDVRLAVMTDELARPLIDLPPDRYGFRPPGTLAEYAQFLGELDVGVAPLLPSPFNLGRTDLKFREYAARGVVGVYAAEGPFPAAVDAGRTGFLYRTPGELVAHLDRLAGDADLLAAVRSAAHAEATGWLRDDGAEDRLVAYRDLLGPTPGDPALPAGLVADSTADGRYFAVRAGEPERAVRAAEAAPDADQRPRLREVVRSHPGYAHARKVAARAESRAGEPREALSLLAPLLGDGSELPSTLTDAAQVYLTSGDGMTARSLLERAVGRNPGHPVAWAVLLRVADADPDAGGLARRAAKNQPRNYLAALAPLRHLAGPDRAACLGEFLDRFAAGLDPEERPYVAAAFARAATAGESLPLELVARACAEFPESARLAEAHADALYAAGRPAAAAAEYARANASRRAALAYQLEYPEPPARGRLWAVAEYARRHGLRGESTESAAGRGGGRDA